MTSWLLVLSLYSNPTGHYVQQFKSESECLKNFKLFVSKNKDNTNIKYIGCVSANM